MHHVDSEAEGPGERLAAAEYAARYEESRALEQALEQLYTATARAYDAAVAAGFHEQLAEHLATIAGLALVQEEQLSAQREHTQLLAQLYLDACR